MKTASLRQLPSEFSHVLRGLVGYIGRDLSMFGAHQPPAVQIRLKKALYSGGYAVGTKVYRLLVRADRRLAAVGEATSKRSVELVIREIRRLTLKASDLLFQVTYFMGHQKMLLLERQALVLDVHEPIVHVAESSADEVVVARRERGFGDLRSRPEAGKGGR
jgi:hypothetical protein